MAGTTTYLVDMVDLLVAGAAVLVLVVVTVVLVRGERPGRVRLTASVALIVLAAGTFAVTLYRGQADKSDKSDRSGQQAAALPSAPASQGFGTAILKVTVPMGQGDKLPQGALWLDPPRPGTDAYTGDLSLLCSTPGKGDHDQNCGGADQRVWTVEPLAGRALLGPATGDPFADPQACAESNGVTYKKDYLQLAAGRGYCVRQGARTYALRIPAFPAQQPLPAQLDVDVAVL